MSNLVKSESVELLSAPETTFGTQPTTGWRMHQPNAGGLKNFYANIKRVRRDPLSKFRATEKGDVIDLDAMPQIDHDLNKELLDYFAVGIFLSQQQFVGTASSSTSGKMYPTAFASTSITVPSGGALPQNTLVYVRGTALNNGLFVVGAGSTGTSIVIAGGQTEVPPVNATVEVVGFQCTSGDLVVASASSLTTTALSLTGLNIPVGSWLWVGGGTAAAPGALGFATAGDRGFIRVTSVAAHALTFDRATQAWSADAGTGKTVQVFFGWFITNVAIDNALYLEQSYQFELALPGLDTGAATDYTYATGGYVDQFDLNGAAVNKIVATLGMKCIDVQNPSTTRATGASSALAPVAQSAFNVVTELPRLRVADKTAANYNANISVDIDNWKLSLKNNVTAQKQQSFFGAKRMIPGKCNVEVTIKAFLVQNDMILAMRDNRDLMFEACLRNNDAGVVFDLPRCEISGGATDYPANGPVTIAETLNAVRDPTLNYVIGMTMFPFLPVN